ncbi:MAG TPA: YbaY family lipoprotein [Phycisphaerales bacterium]|nr:YbaY family lipoprotein [Phycisphaerales bacterium]
MRTAHLATILIASFALTGCGLLSSGGGTGGDNGGGRSDGSGGGGSGGGGTGGGSDSVTTAKYSGHVKGTVTFRERIMLPPECTVIIQLIDASTPDAKPQIIGEQRFLTAGKAPPYTFNVLYDPAKINPQATYKVRAEISLRGTQRFTTPSPLPVITQGAPSIADLTLQSARQ